MAPLDVVDPSLHVTVDGAVATGYLFYKAKKYKLAASAASAQADIVLVDATDVAVADRLVLMGDDGLLDQYEVLSKVSNAVTLTGNLNNAVTSGGTVYTVQGVQAAKTGVAYGVGAESLTNTAWGYTIEFDHAYAPTAVDGMLLEAYATVYKSGTGALYSQSWDVQVADARGAP